MKALFQRFVTEFDVQINITLVVPVPDLKTMFTSSQLLPSTQKTDGLIVKTVIFPSGNRGEISANNYKRNIFQGTSFEY